MKTKLLFLSAMVMGAFACNKVDEGAASGGANLQETEMQKASIAISSPKTRAINTSGNVNGTFTEVENGYLYFFDGEDNNGVLVYSHLLTEDELSAINTNNSASNNGNKVNSFEVDIPISATQMFVVTNGGTAYSSIAEGNTLKSVQEVSVDVASQNKNAGRGVQGVAMVSEAVSDVILVEDSASEYDATAAATLAPLVARIEIKGTLCGTSESEGQVIKSFNVSGIYNNLYAEDMSLGRTAGDIYGAKDNGTVDKEWLTKYKASMDASMKDVTGLSTNASVAYHLFATTTPHIIIEISHVMVGDASNPGDSNSYKDGSSQYVLIDQFMDCNGSPITKLEPGMVYKISDIALPVSVLKEDPYEDERKTNVEVTIKPWSSADVTVLPK